jgi:GNAT superfamily N-acetyltransferase
MPTLYVADPEFAPAERLLAAESGAALRERPTIERLDNAATAAAAPALAALVLDAVDDGASVGFMSDVTRVQAADYWRGIAAARDERVVLVARDAQGIVGVVALTPASGGFQPHRADIAKMIVHRRARGRGIATALMRSAEQWALALGRTHLMLFTRSGSDAEGLYRKLGWIRAGLLVQDSLRPDGTLCDAAIFTKRIG